MQLFMENLADGVQRDLHDPIMHDANISIIILLENFDINGQTQKNQKKD